MKRILKLCIVDSKPKVGNIYLKVRGNENEGDEDFILIKKLKPEAKVHVISSENYR